MKQQTDSYEHLKVKYIEGVKEQKELYNKVLELKGSQCSFSYILAEALVINQRTFLMDLACR